MCFKSKGSSQAAQATAAEQAKQEAAAAEAKAAAQAAAKKAQAEAIEKARAEAIEVYKAEQEAKRQSESDKTVDSSETLQLIRSLQASQQSLLSAQQGFMTKQTQEAEKGKDLGPALSMAAQRQQRISKFGSIATRGRVSRRSGSRSRRSLITGLGGGIGYYDRFAK